MFNIGTQELLVILVLALVVVGPQKLPEIARSIGRGMREFRKMQDEVKDMVKVDLNPEPPSVYKPGVSGPKVPRAAHRTPRPAAADGAVTSGDAVAGPRDADVDATEPDADADAPEPDVAHVDEPPASAGAG